MKSIDYYEFNLLYHEKQATRIANPLNRNAEGPKKINVFQTRSFSPTSHFVDLRQRFVDKITKFDDLFISYRESVADKARLNFLGIARNGIRKNMSQIARHIPDATPDDLQNFISDSKWSVRAVMDRVVHVQQVNEQIGDPIDACLLSMNVVMRRKVINR